MPALRLSSTAIKSLQSQSSLDSLSEVSSSLETSTNSKYDTPRNILVRRRWNNIAVWTEPNCTALAQNLLCCLCLRFNGHFPGGPGLADTRMSPFWIVLELRMTVWWWQLELEDVQNSIQIVTDNKPHIYRPDGLPVAQPTVSKHWREKYWREKYWREKYWREKYWREGLTYWTVLMSVNAYLYRVVL